LNLNREVKMASDVDVAAVGSGLAADTPPGGAVSAVSWPAIFAGAVVAAAVTIIMVALGSGLGLASISPWSMGRPGPVSFTVMAAIWLVLTQWFASGVGGYLTGRLRTRWIGVHTHEVFFRDTAHGFLAWALASLAVVALVGAAAGMAASAGVRAATTPSATDEASPVASAVTAPFQGLAYDVDTLFRSDRPDASASAADARAEAARILTAGAVNGAMPPSDSIYLGQLVSDHAFVTPAEARRRVDAIVVREQDAANKVRLAADAARKAGAAFGLITALSMLIGALVASVAAALGGMQRDEHI
jgi:hypothetical protein